VNFASRTSCRKCSNPKQGSNANVNPAPIVPKPGDWNCECCIRVNLIRLGPKCSELNFGTRTQCFKCGEAKEGSSSKESSECVICMEKPSRLLIASCGHLGLCEVCGPQVDKCPVCRVPFKPEQLIKVFTV
jgi:hypothetical protein